MLGLVGAPAPFVDCSWALHCLRCLSGWLCCLLLYRLWGCAGGYTWTGGGFYTPCAAARKRSAIYHCAARDGFHALCAAVLGCCVAPWLAAPQAPLSLASSRLCAQRASGGWPCSLSLRVYPRAAVPAIRRGTRVFDSERRIPTSCPPSCHSAGGRPRIQALGVYPRVTVPLLSLGTKVFDSSLTDRRSAGSCTLAFCLGTPSCGAQQQVREAPGPASLRPLVVVPTPRAPDELCCGHRGTRLAPYSLPSPLSSRVGSAYENRPGSYHPEGFCTGSTSPAWGGGGGISWRVWAGGCQLEGVGGGFGRGGGRFPRWGSLREPLLPHAYLQGGCVFGAGLGKLVAVLKQGL